MRENEDLIKEFKRSKAEIESKDIEVQRLTGQVKKFSDKFEKIREKLFFESETQTKTEVIN